jgi:hypothetical protein
MQRSAAVFFPCVPPSSLGSWPAPTSGDPFDFAESIRNREIDIHLTAPVPASVPVPNQPLIAISVGDKLRSILVQGS